MDLDKLLSDHFAVHQDRSYGEKHHDISMRFAIELLKELSKKGVSYPVKGHPWHRTAVPVVDIESLRLELEMQLNTTKD